MHVQIHAKRYGDTEEDRDQRYFNRNAAAVPIDKGDKVELVGEGNGVQVMLNGKPSIYISLSEYGHTAIAFVYGDAPPSGECW